MRKKKLALSLSLAALACAFAASVSTAGEDWKPTRAVNIYCWSSAGGFTDLSNRALAVAFKEEFGVPFNVTNMLGGGGGTAANHVFNQPRDGYSILGSSDAFHALGIRGAFKYPNSVWEPMFLINAKGVISVRADSPIETLADLVKALKDAEAKGVLIRGGASQAGNVWGCKMVQFTEVVGAKVNVLPYEGSSQTLVGLLSGEIDVALCGLAEQEDYIKAGQIRPIAMIEPEAFTMPGIGVIPSLARDYPEFGKMKQAMQWCGIALPADTPEEILAAYRRAFIKAADSKPVRDFATSRNIDIITVTGKEADKLMAENDSVYAWIIYDSGLAVKSPEEFGIPRP